MANNRDENQAAFISALRTEHPDGLGKGWGRSWRLMGSSAKLARKLLAAGKGNTDVDLSPRDLEKVATLVQQLGSLKGLPMKFGQIISYLDLELPEEMRRMLASLQTQSAATPQAEIEATLHADLGLRGPALWQGLNPEPVSIASIGQVYRGHLPSGEEVAVKVRHPAIADAIRSDFRFASVATGLSSALVPGMGATARDFTAEMEARLLEECDYSLEAERQRLFGQLFAAHPCIVVPRVYDGWCGARVLTTAWEEGQTFDHFCNHAPQEARDRAGAALFDFYIGALYRFGLFHADPHPGNYALRNDGHVVVFDYGCVRVFEPAVATAFAALAQAVRDDQREAICEALRQLGAEPSKNDKTYAHLRGLLRGFFGPMLTPGPHRIESRIAMKMSQIARDKIALARLRLPGRLLFLFRIRFGLFAVLARLGAVNDWAALERQCFDERGTSPALVP